MYVLPSPSFLSPYFSPSLHVSSSLLCLPLCVSSHCLPSLSCSPVHAFFSGPVSLGILVCVLVFLVLHWQHHALCSVCSVLFPPVSSPLIHFCCVAHVFPLPLSPLCVFIMWVYPCQYRVVSSSYRVVCSSCIMFRYLRLSVPCPGFMFQYLFRFTFPSVVQFVYQQLKTRVSWGHIYTSYHRAWSCNNQTRAFLWIYTLFPLLIMVFFPPLDTRLVNSIASKLKVSIASAYPDSLSTT